MFFKLSLYQVGGRTEDYIDVFLHTDATQLGHVYFGLDKEYYRNGVVPHRELVSLSMFETKQTLDLQQFLQKHFL